MKSWFWSSVLFLLGYGIGSVVGFGLFLVSETMMWVGMFTVMPVVFAYLFYAYLRRVKCEPEVALREIVRVAVYWMVLSFLFDASVYIVLVPAIYGAPANWRFFVDQSPWIWLSYLSILVLGLVGRWFYVRRSGDFGQAA